MKKIILITKKELTENWSKKLFLSFILFFIIYAGYLNFLSLDIYTNVSVNIASSPQIIMSADPNQGILAPLFSNFFLLFLLIFPIIVSTSISAEKENGTFDILRLNFKPTQILAGKFFAYFILASFLFVVAFLFLLPYVVSGGFVDIKYTLNLICGFLAISFLWIAISLFISAITSPQTSFYVIIIFNILLLGIDFISGIVSLNILKFLQNLVPYNFYIKILSGIFDLKFYLGYILSSLFLFVVTLFQIQHKKYTFYIMSIVLFLIFLLLVLQVNKKYDFTFNKINSLSENSIKVLDKIKNKKVEVNLYIKENEAKWQTANDLIKLYRMNFDNIRFNFLDPEMYGVEYGAIEFQCKNRKAKTLSIDEDVFTGKIYYVATGNKINVNTKRQVIGYPYKFKQGNKIFYLFWIIFILFAIIIVRKAMIK